MPKLHSGNGTGRSAGMSFVGVVYCVCFIGLFIGCSCVYDLVYKTWGVGASFFGSGCGAVFG